MKKILITTITLGLLSCGDPPKKNPTTDGTKVEVKAPDPVKDPPASSPTTVSVPPGELPPIGAKAPAVQLKDQAGALVDLSSFVGKSAVVLYFYPKDDTPGCTIEAKDFRDRSTEIEALGAKVIGVSLDPVESHQLFADKYDLNFSILSDADQSVSKAYGVLGAFGDSVISKRTTFLIGKDGNIKKIFTDVQVNVHGQEVIKALQEGVGG